MHVVQWIELSIGAHGNEGIQKLARCLKHQLYQWAYFSFFSAFSHYFGEFLYMWLNGLSSLLGPLVTRGFQSCLDA